MDRLLCAALFSHSLLVHWTRAIQKVLLVVGTRYSRLVVELRPFFVTHPLPAVRSTVFKCRPSGLVGNLHTCWCGSREFDSYQSRVCVLSS